MARHTFLITTVKYTAHSATFGLPDRTVTGLATPHGATPQGSYIVEYTRKIKDSKAFTTYSLDPSHNYKVFNGPMYAAYGTEGLLALLAFGQELNTFSFIGLVLLVGLVKKNGIMMVGTHASRHPDRPSRNTGRGRA